MLLVHSNLVVSACPVPTYRAWSCSNCCCARSLSACIPVRSIQKRISMSTYHRCGRKGSRKTQVSADGTRWVCYSAAHSNTLNMPHDKDKQCFSVFIPLTYLSISLAFWTPTSRSHHLRTNKNTICSSPYNARVPLHQRTSQQIQLITQ